MTAGAGKAKRLTLGGGLLNVALLLAVAGLSMVVFFALLDGLLLLVAALLASGAGSPTRGNYALVTARNLWLIGGGALLVAFVIFCLDYGFKHWRERRMQRLFLRLLAAELLIIGLQRLAAG